MPNHGLAKKKCKKKRKLNEVLKRDQKTGVGGFCFDF